jgi:hypothetical protein
MSSSQSLAIELADALQQQAVQAGAGAPSVRGSDWRLATVATVNSDGTVDTSDGVKARRAGSYIGPLVGDIIRISQSSSGNWVAEGTLGSGNATWTALTLSGGWTATAGYYVPAYRLNGDGTASLCGLSSMSGTLAAGATVATLPVEARPANRARCSVQVAAGFFGVMTLNTDGTITLGDYNPTLPGAGTKYSQFDVFSRYRMI